MFVCSIGSLLWLAAACGGGTIDDIPLPSTGGTGGGTTGGTGGGTTGGTGGGTTGGTGGTTGGTGGTTGGTGGTTGGTGGTTGGTGGTTGGTGGTTGGTGGTTGGTGGTTGGTTGGAPMGGMAGTDVPMGGMPGTGGAYPMGGMGATGAEAGSGGSAGQGPYSPRTGSFKVFAYFNTDGGFTHTAAIAAGKTMLMTMGTKQGFEVTFSDKGSDVNAENLANYELFFGLDPTGDNLSEQKAPGAKVALEAWMRNNGAFAGVHSSTDFMDGWAFWSEVTGQNYDLHDTCCSSQNIQWEAAASTFIAVVGIPSPWQRSEEWYKFNSWQQWSTKPGFMILSRVTTDGNTRPVSYIREWENFRSFYTSLGHEAPTYSDANFVKHVSAGIMWAVRREALLKQ
jgi:type 1 glutamine amidotransferase